MPIGSDARSRTSVWIWMISGKGRSFCRCGRTLPDRHASRDRVGIVHGFSAPPTLGVGSGHPAQLPLLVRLTIKMAEPVVVAPSLLLYFPLMVVEALTAMTMTCRPPPRRVGGPSFCCWHKYWIARRVFQHLLLTFLRFIAQNTSERCNGFWSRRPTSTFSYGRCHERRFDSHRRWQRFYLGNSADRVPPHRLGESRVGSAVFTSPA